MGLVLKEHVIGRISWSDDITSDVLDANMLKLTKDSFAPFHDLRSKAFRQGHYCYEVSHYADKNLITVHPGYFIGLDWLVRGHRYIQVEPKINSKAPAYFSDQSSITDEEIETRANIENKAEQEITAGQVDYININYQKMLLDAMSDGIVAKECTDLVKIEWEKERIPINQDQDQLTPFLVVQFLQLTRKIVQKGLKKSYYQVQENLTNRVKGKILIGAQIKHNALKNRLTKTYCSYQVFGEDNMENRFLKKVLDFTSSYVENNIKLFKGNESEIRHLVSYVRPAFEHVGSDIAEEQLRHLKHNPFFKEYKETIRIGHFILQQFAYNIKYTAVKKIEMPPFWIDMPRLFELYVYQKLLQANEYNTEKIKYQFSTYGNALDILIKDRERSMIIDAKYKLHYKHSHVHNDIRQVAGYARLKKVRHELNIHDDQQIDCLIIYPDIEGTDNFSLHNIHSLKNDIAAYYRVYKLGVALPQITQ
jgi:5-methylcytosine-specific restriction enzyme subunit McrC